MSQSSRPLGTPVLLSPRARVVPILGLFQVGNGCDGLNHNGDSIDDDTFDQGLPHPANQGLAGFGRLVLGLSDQVLVEVTGKLLLFGADEGCELLDRIKSVTGMESVSPQFR